jgi:hypothetical protein
MVSRGSLPNFSPSERLFPRIPRIMICLSSVCRRADQSAVWDFRMTESSSWGFCCTSVLVSTIVGKIGWRDRLWEFRRDDSSAL